MMKIPLYLGRWVNIKLKRSYHQVVLPELAVLRFGVYDDSDKLLGQVKLHFSKNNKNNKTLKLFRGFCLSTTSKWATAT